MLRWLTGFSPRERSSPPARGERGTWGQDGVIRVKRGGSIVIEKGSSGVAGFLVYDKNRRGLKEKGN